jgi:hypothetical protein
MSRGYILVKVEGILHFIDIARHDKGLGLEKVWYEVNSFNDLILSCQIVQ